MTEQKSKQIFWKTATPEDFKNIELLDWIEGIGDVTTYYEVKFVRRFGEFLSHPDARTSLMSDVINEYEKRLKDGEVVVGLKPAIALIKGDNK